MSGVRGSYYAEQTKQCSQLVKSLRLAVRYLKSHQNSRQAESKRRTEKAAKEAKDKDTVEREKAKKAVEDQRKSLK
eukprot:4281188-Alexandrium_andersonii.AAC.1